MPMGSHHVITGILRWDGEPGFYLAVDGGGEWQLDFPSPLADAAEEHIDARVTVEGVRIGFNILAVHLLRRSLPHGELEVGMRRWWRWLFG